MTTDKEQRQNINASRLAATALRKLRKICGRLPGASETVTFGHPTFRVGEKIFAVLEEYKGELGIALKVEQFLQDVFLKDPRFFRTPYIGKHGWVTFRMNPEPSDWKEVAEMVEGSYRLVAPDRLKQGKTALRPPQSKVPPKRP